MGGMRLFYEGAVLINQLGWGVARSCMFMLHTVLV